MVLSKVRDIMAMSMFRKVINVIKVDKTKKIQMNTSSVPFEPYVSSWKSPRPMRYWWNRASMNLEPNLSLKIYLRSSSS